MLSAENMGQAASKKNYSKKFFFLPQTLLQHVIIQEWIIHED